LSITIITLFALKVVILILRRIFQMIKLGTLHLTVCIALENYNNNDLQLNRLEFRWQFLYWPTKTR